MHDDLQTQGEGCAGRRLLVDQSLQRAGFFEPKSFNAHTLNNVTAKQSAEGSVAIQFGGCDGKIPNCLPTPKGWNCMMRFLSAARRGREWHLEIPRGAGAVILESNSFVVLNVRCWVERRPSANCTPPACSQMLSGFARV
jgi:hypothetical protein